jgi:hypothetical protein
MAFCTLPGCLTQSVAQSVSRQRVSRQPLTLVGTLPLHPQAQQGPRVRTPRHIWILHDLQIAPEPLAVDGNTQEEASTRTRTQRKQVLNTRGPREGVKTALVGSEGDSGKHIGLLDQFH